MHTLADLIRYAKSKGFEHKGGLNGNPPYLINRWTKPTDVKMETLGDIKPNQELLPARLETICEHLGLSVEGFEGWMLQNPVQQALAEVDGLNTEDVPKREYLKTGPTAEN